MLKVLIWQNAWGPKALKHPGHAALAIANGAKAETYVSWWPDQSDPNFQRNNGYRAGYAQGIAQDYFKELGANARTRLQAGAAPRPGQSNDALIQEPGFAIQNPAMSWVQRPDQILDIPAFDDRVPRDMASIGLCEKNVEDWWKLYSEKKLGYTRHRYTFVSKTNNCASIVMAALIAGGCDLYLKHDKAFIYYTPSDIFNYATRLRNKILEMNTRAQAVNASMLASHRKMTPNSRDMFGSCNPDGTGDVWSVADWRAASAVKIGRRKEQIAQIDSYLAQYWSVGQEWNDANCTMKSTYLACVLQEVQSHIIEKPNSDRREAVLRLGSQCIMVLRERAAQCEIWSDLIRMTVGTDL